MIKALCNRSFSYFGNIGKKVNNPLYSHTGAEIVRKIPKGGTVTKGTVVGKVDFESRVSLTPCLVFFLLTHGLWHF